MKTYNNVLSLDTIQAIQDETVKTRGEDVWRMSTLSWAPDIRLGIMGTTGCKELAPEVKAEVERQIKWILPPYENLYVQIYLWPPLSGISAHNDGHKKFGATIYLNDNWQLNYGGLFVWQDKESQELKVRMPEFNSIVLNDNQELHLVTPVACGCPIMRHTLQIWGV